MTDRRDKIEIPNLTIVRKWTKERKLCVKLMDRMQDDVLYIQGEQKKNCDINGKNSRKINNGSDYRLTQHHPSIHQVNNFVKRYLFLV